MTDFATVFAVSQSFAPVVLQMSSFVAPSPSPAIIMESFLQTAVSASRNVLYASFSSVISSFSASPFAIMASVSFVEVSPSTLIMLNVVSAAALTAFCSIGTEMAQSVVTKHSIVAMFGWIMPEPLEMPPMRTSLSPSVIFTAHSFSMVSVVMMAFAAMLEPFSFSSAANAGAAFSIGAIGKICPITPVDATMTSCGSMPSASPAISHMRHAFFSPSALQVLAFPLLQMTACARPSAIFLRVTRIGAPFTRFCV